MASLPSGKLPLNPCVPVVGEAEEVDVCQTGTTADCPKLSTMFDARAFEAVALAGHVNSFKECTETDAEKTANGVGRTDYAGMASECGGAAKHVYITSTEVKTYSETLDAKVKETKAQGWPAPDVDSAAGLVALAGASLPAASMLA